MANKHRELDQILLLFLTTPRQAKAYRTPVKLLLQLLSNTSLSNGCFDYARSAYCSLRRRRSDRSCIASLPASPVRLDSDRGTARVRIGAGLGDLDHRIPQSVPNFK